MFKPTMQVPGDVPTGWSGTMVFLTVPRVHPQRAKLIRTHAVIWYSKSFVFGREQTLDRQSRPKSRAEAPAVYDL